MLALVGLSVACASARAVSDGVELPRAAGSVRDPGDQVATRLVITLDRRGRTIAFGRFVDREWLRIWIQRARRLERIRRSSDDLFVLVQADRRTRWADVVAVIETVEREGLTRLQFACASESTAEPEPEFSLSQGLPCSKLDAPLARTDGRGRVVLLTAPGDVELQVVIKRIEALARTGVESYRFEALPTPPLASRSP